MLPSIVISDTSGLILLTKINQLSLLPQLFHTCYLTPTVAAEYRQPLPGWLQIRTPVGHLPADLLTRAIHAGEYSALVLAQEIPGSLLLLDDAPARQLARQLELPFTGTAGLLVPAKKQGFILAVRPLIIELRAVGMWLTDEVAERICRAAGE